MPEDCRVKGYCMYVQYHSTLVRAADVRGMREATKPSLPTYKYLPHTLGTPRSLERRA